MTTKQTYEIKDKSRDSLYRWEVLNVEGTDGIVALVQDFTNMVLNEVGFAPIITINGFGIGKHWFMFNKEETYPSLVAVFTRQLNLDIIEIEFFNAGLHIHVVEPESFPENILSIQSTGLFYDKTTHKFHPLIEPRYPDVSVNRLSQMTGVLDLSIHKEYLDKHWKMTPLPLIDETKEIVPENYYILGKGR